MIVKKTASSFFQRRKANPMPLTTSLDQTNKPLEIPERLQDELRLQLLETLLESVPELVAIYSLVDLKAVYFNKAASKRFNPENLVDLTQLGLPEIIGLSSLQLLQSEILPRAQVLGHWSGACEFRDSWGSEFRTEAVFTVRTRRQNQSEGYLCMRALEQSNSGKADDTNFSDRHLLHALLNHADDSIYFKDSFSRFLRISRAQAKKLGLNDPKEAIGKTDFDMFTAEHASPAFTDEKLIISTGQPMLAREEKETYEDGHVTWCSTSKFPLLDENGKILGTFGISRDITSKKLAEQSQREMEIQLQLAQKLESIGRLAAGVAHEINTPTQFITDNVRFLTDAMAKIEAVFVQYSALRSAAAESPACAAAIEASAAVEKEVELDYLFSEIPGCLKQSQDGLSRITRIVQSLKEFAHPNSPELTPSNLNQTIETSITVSRHEWKYVAEVVTDLAPELPLVPCVVDEFNQVMLNLIVNAAHAVGDALKQRGGESGKITIRTRLEAPWAVVEVEDTGTGIPEEIRSRIFEPFFTTKAVGKGTGQGLTIVQTVIVKHHHGTVELTSELGRGTKFILRLPLLVETPPLPSA
jgi:PAS domain S-box-containing protein